MIAPFAEYTHAATGGCSITGGYVYTGSVYPNMLNKYFFADYCQNRMGILNITTGAITYTPFFNGNNNFTSFGEDVNGELYITGGNSLLRITDSSMGTSQFNQIGLTFAPNPSKGKINIQNPQLLSISRVELHDITGKKMAEFQPEISNIIELNTEGIRPGIYFLQIENNGNRYTEKIIFE
jgi:hypothetical protein